MKEHINNENVFVPKTDFVFPEEPDIPFLEPDLKKDVVFDENYPYLDKSFKAKLWSGFVYFVIYSVVFLLQKIRYGLKIKGRKNITKNKKLFKNGAISVCNHVYRWDFLAVLQAARYRRMHFPARAENLKTNDAPLIVGAGGIPVPATIKAFHQFNLAFDELLQNKQWVHVFSESCRWDYYQPIRPFKKGAFTWAYKFDVPLVPMVISYRDPQTSFFHRLLKTKHPLITITVGEPLFIDKTLTKKEATFKLRKECHQKMCEMAGIKQNQWEPEGD